MLLASGASQTGFGRTGTVIGKHQLKQLLLLQYLVKDIFVILQASGAFTLTLTCFTISAGDDRRFKRLCNGNFNTANLTIGRNGSEILRVVMLTDFVLR